MKTTCRTSLALVAALSLNAGGAAVRVAAAQDERAAVRIGGDYTILAGEQVEQVVVLSGAATIHGAVDDDVVVVLGTATLAGTGRVGGDFVVVTGSARIEPGAVVAGDVVVVGGGLDAPPDFMAGGEQVVIGSFGLTERFAAAGPWFRKALLWGRPLAPDLPWTWGLLAAIALLYFAIGIVFERPVRTCAQALVDKPLTTGLAGVLVLLVIGPACVVLAVSVIGLALVPLLFAAVFVAGLIGRVGAVRWIGGLVAAEQSPANRMQALRSVAIGLALICLAYMVPVLGLITWTVLGVFGLGAAATAFIDGIKQENPAPAGSPPSSSAPVADAVLAAGAAPEAGPGAADAAAGGSSRAAAAADLSALPRADFLSRLGAVVLDVLLVIIASALLNLHDGMFFLILLGYHVVFWAAKGTTVGGVICCLRIARADGGPIGYAEAVVRGLASIFSAAVAGLGWLWMLWDAERQTWHDRIAGTVVVRVPRNWPL